MKNKILSIIMICMLSFTSKLFAQCTPDTSFKTTGTIPSVLQSATVGLLYNQVIQYHITKDTTVFVASLGTTVDAKIDTLWITGVAGMPAGFSYTCHNSACKIQGGKTGCATLTGTPLSSQVGIYPLLVLIKIRATASLGGFPVAQTINDTNARYSIVVNNPTGIGNLVENKEPIVFPNPASEELQIYVPGLREDANFSIVNVQGQIIQTGIIAGNGEVNHLKLGLNQKGIYFIQIKTESNNWVKKFLVE